MQYRSRALGVSKLETYLTFGKFALSYCLQVSNMSYYSWHPRLLPLHQSNDPYVIPMNHSYSFWMTMVFCSGSAQ